MEFNGLPTSIDVKLYKYNYVDNKIWTQLKNYTDWIEVADNPDSIIVHADEVAEILEVFYKRDLHKISATGAEFLHRSVNSSYFLYKILEEMHKVEYIKFSLDMDRTYSRMVDTEDEKLLRFDYKVLTITLRMHEYFTESELKILNEVLTANGIFESNKPYIQARLSELTVNVDTLANKIEDDKAGDLLAGLIDIIDPKIHNDNPLVLLVTDY